MKYGLIFLYMLNFLFSLIKSQELRFVFALFRHGARAPYYLEKDNFDLFGNKWIKESDITPAGIRQHYLIGYRNKEKYFQQLNITNLHYNNLNEISVFSTNKDRTIMSAYSQIFGMFPPTTGPLLTDSQLEHSDPPIKNFDFEKAKIDLKLENKALGSANLNGLPVRLFDNYSYYFDLHDPAVCPRVQSFLDENEKLSSYQQWIKDFKKNYGEKILRIINKRDYPEFIDNAYNVYLIFDTFESNYYDQRNLTKFTQERIDIEEFHNLTKSFYYLTDFTYYYGDKNTFIARFSYSPIFENLIKQIDARIDLDQTGKDYYNPNNPKLLFYFGHDTNLAAMQMFLKYVFMDQIKLYDIYFASAFYYELYKNKTLMTPNKFAQSNKGEDRYYLNIYFDDQNVFAGPIIYSYFKENIINNLIPYEDVLNFCKVNTGDKTYVRYILIIILSIFIILPFIFGFYIFKYYFRNQRENRLEESYYEKKV